MGKAFSEEDRLAIHKRLQRVGLKLFAEKGIKGVSIRELTTAAQISQGGFYTFYKDKEDFMIDLMALRIRQKLTAYWQNRDQSLANPIQYLADILYGEGMHLKDHKAFSNGLSGSIKFFYDEEQKMNRQLSGYYRDFLVDLVNYWHAQNYRVKVDIAGLMSVIRAAGILFSNSDLINEQYFAAIYRTFCDAAVSRFIEIDKVRKGV